MNLKQPYQSAARRTFLDGVIDGYVTWREESAAVTASYRSWDRAPRDERATAFAAYVAALDREEQAASAYRRLLERAAAT